MWLSSPNEPSKEVARQMCVRATRCGSGGRTPPHVVFGERGLDTTDGRVAAYPCDGGLVGLACIGVCWRRSICQAEPHSRLDRWSTRCIPRLGVDHRRCGIRFGCGGQRPDRAHDAPRDRAPSGSNFRRDHRSQRRAVLDRGWDVGRRICPSRNTRAGRVARRRSNIRRAVGCRGGDGSATRMKFAGAKPIPTRFLGPRP